MTKIACHINGQLFQGEVDSALSLLEFLREQGFTSLKESCGVGECGACTALIDDVPTDTCIYLAVWANGKKIRTTEGEATAKGLSKVQQAYVNHGAIQCGFCTPGLVMTSTALVEKYQGKKLSHEKIRQELAGNLCRCTGYEKVIDAVEEALQKKTKAPSKN